MKFLEQGKIHSQGNPSSLTNSQGNASILTQDLALLKAAADDAENRLLRNNLLFFGIKDSQTETWAESEDAVVGLCAQSLNITIDKSQLERAHRIGSFQPNKNRPIVAKFCRFKDKDFILASGAKLKDTDFAVREDFSATVRHARRKLLEFARQHDGKFEQTYLIPPCVPRDEMPETTTQN